jgi:predicted permease
MHFILAGVNSIPNNFNMSFVCIFDISFNFFPPISSVNIDADARERSKTVAEINEFHKKYLHFQRNWISYLKLLVVQPPIYRLLILDLQIWFYLENIQGRRFQKNQKRFITSQILIHH